MKIYISEKNDKGYLLTRINEDLIVIDDYNGPLELSDTVFVNCNSFPIGRYEYKIGCKSYWLNFSGDIPFVSDFMQL